MTLRMVEMGGRRGRRGLGWKTGGVAQVGDPTSVTLVKEGRLHSLLQVFSEFVGPGRLCGMKDHLARSITGRERGVLGA